MSVGERKSRFKKFAIAVAKLMGELPQTMFNQAYCNRVIRSSRLTNQTASLANQAPLPIQYSAFVMLYSSL
jgi:hypothetical protein